MAVRERPRHLGHVAGPGVPSDVFARYHRLKGNDVLMVSGTDEHGTPVMVSADREGVTPRELADRNNALILDDYVRLGMTYDCFTRTTTRNHYAVVQDMFRTLYDKGFLIEQTTLGAIAPATGRTLPDRYIEGPARSAATARREATSATTAATSSIRST